MFDYKELKLQITRKYDTQAKFAEAMDMDITSLNQRLNGKVDWKAKEIVKACVLLDIALADSWKYFFTVKL